MRAGYFFRYFVKNLAFVTIFGLASAPVLSVTKESGNLGKYLNSIDFGDKNAGDWQSPDQTIMDQYAQAVSYFLAGDMDNADAIAQLIGFEVVEFTDGKGKNRSVHYLLREATGLPSANFIGGGTLVMNPNGRNIVLQAPHPVSDLYTGRQAIDTYLSVDASYLMLPGTRRDNAPDYSDCTNGSYRQSDASHHTTQLFYTAHEQLSLSDPERIFLQFHGFGTSSLNTLQEQCGTDNNLLINLSEGIDYPSDPNATTFMHTLRRNVETDGLISACVYGNDTSYLGATSTTTGRFTNGSLNACHTNSTESSQRWVHLEQSYTIRSQYRKKMSNYIDAAIGEYFSAP